MEVDCRDVWGDTTNDAGQKRGIMRSRGNFLHEAWTATEGEGMRLALGFDKVDSGQNIKRRGDLDCLL